ncbi:MAG: aldehyde ferredoxin oxidoreductase family protein [Deltaproteobacteria bacterium]|nr:aldehyde ferredoxin oxidoreductase family protein [Deltaproteobacteria bacterium]MBW2130353.1 aldehyde ferredoxin oxidoreductase family protein [Deltaproteobacteria bacterium]
MKGFFNRILWIDLTNRKYHTEEIDDNDLKRTLGGKGLATRLLLERNPEGVEPFSPANLFILALGPVSDTRIFGSSRYGLYTKSPQTGYYSESYSGGHVAEYMSRTGYDAFILEGAAEEPVYLEIREQGVFFHNAKHLWGRDTYETEDMIKSELGESRTGIISIGPAGENLVTCAVVENNYWRSAGRTGAGAVLGSKKVKALAFYGEKKREVADPDGLEELVRKFKALGKDNKGVEAYRNFGTPMMVRLTNSLGAFPTKYWHEGSLEGWENLSAERMQDQLKPKPKACSRCFMACGKFSEVQDGRHKGLKIEGPEYETIYAFGGLCLIKDLREIAYLNDICDRLGLDTITAGNLCAFAMEASAMENIPEKVPYGDPDTVASLLKDIAGVRGLGRILSKGIRHAAREWNMDEVAIHVKGLEPAGYDPRCLKGMALAYATSPRGACHLRTTFYKAEVSGLLDGKDIREQVSIFLDFEERLALHDMLIVCRFYRDLYPWEELSRIIYVTTGMDLDKNALSTMASSVLDSTRIYNIREGLSNTDDHLPNRFFDEPIGEHKETLDRSTFEHSLKEYYRQRKWSEKGIPSQAPFLPQD